MFKKRTDGWLSGEIRLGADDPEFGVLVVAAHNQLHGYWAEMKRETGREKLHDSARGTWVVVFASAGYMK